MEKHFDSLITALQSDNLEGAREAIDSGADVNQLSNKGHLPICLAANACVDAIPYLIEAGVKFPPLAYFSETLRFGARTPEQRDPLSHAIDSDDMESFDQVLALPGCAETISYTHGHFWSTAANAVAAGKPAFYAKLAVASALHQVGDRLDAEEAVLLEKSITRLVENLNLGLPEEEYECEPPIFKVRDSVIGSDFEGIARVGFQFVDCICHKAYKDDINENALYPQCANKTSRVARRLRGLPGSFIELTDASADLGSDIFNMSNGTIFLSADTMALDKFLEGRPTTMQMGDFYAAIFTKEFEVARNLIVANNSLLDLDFINDDIVRTASIYSSPEVISLIMDHSKNLERLFAHGTPGNDPSDTALHIAIKSIRPGDASQHICKIVDNLISRGVDLNRPDADGYSPLLLAVNAQQGPLITKMLRAGAQDDDLESSLRMRSPSEANDALAIYNAARSKVAVEQLLASQKPTGTRLSI